MLHFLASLFAALGLMTGASAPTPAPQTFGSITPVGASQFTLAGAGINSTQSTIQLTSFTTPDGRAITMSMLGTIGYGALEPQTTAKLEDVTFSGVVQNTNGTATLTGVTRGNDFVTPYAASTTLAHAHAGGATFILTNTAGFYTQFYSLSNAATSTNILAFSSTSPPRYDFVAAQGTGSAIATTSELASVAYVNAVALVSAPNAATGVKGVAQLATALQAASSTSLGSTGAALVLASVNATDTPQRGCAVGYTGTAGAGCTPVADLGGHLKQLWIDLTAAFTWTGLHTFSAGLLATASSTFSGTLSVATTTSSTNMIGKKFGGTGADGALTCSSGTTTIDLGSATILEKNYSSISITGTCLVQFSSPASTGSIVVWKSQGNVTITSSNNPAVDLRALGTVNGVGGTGSPVGSGGAGSGGASMTAAGLTGAVGSNIGDTIPPTAGTDFGKWIYSLTGTSETGGGASGSCNGAAIPVSTSPALPTSNSIPNYSRFYVMPGTGGGGGCPGTAGTGGDGGRGAGALYMEVGGALNITSTINATGSSSPAVSASTKGCGGGGGGGAIQIVYNYLTANTGTYSVAGGTSGGTCSQTGGAGGAGYSSVTQNTSF